MFYQKRLVIEWLSCQWQLHWSNPYTTITFLSSFYWSWDPFYSNHQNTMLLITLFNWILFVILLTQHNSYEFEIKWPSERKVLNLFQTTAKTETTLDINNRQLLLRCIIRGATGSSNPTWRSPLLHFKIGFYGGTATVLLMHDMS